jgi:hypothetical protein
LKRAKCVGNPPDRVFASHLRRGSAYPRGALKRFGVQFDPFRVYHRLHASDYTARFLILVGGAHPKVRWEWGSADLALQPVPLGRTFTRGPGPRTRWSFYQNNNIKVAVGARCANRARTDEHHATNPATTGCNDALGERTCDP